MEPTPVDGIADTYTVDTGLYGVEGALSLYVVDATEPTLVDTGAATTTGAVYDALDALDIDRTAVQHVLVTHVHLDHAGGAGELARELPNATFYLHPAGAAYLTDPERLERLKASVDRAMGTEDAYGVPEPVPEDRTVVVSDGESVDVGDHRFRLLDAPGHAPHHFAAFDETTEGLFSIDAAGMYLDGAMRPTTPPPSFDLEVNLRTIDRLSDLSPTRNLYGHFGPGGSDPLSELARYADLLPEWVALVDERRREHDSVDEVVASLGSGWYSPTVARDVAGVFAYLDSTTP